MATRLPSGSRGHLPTLGLCTGAKGSRGAPDPRKPGSERRQEATEGAGPSGQRLTSHRASGQSPVVPGGEPAHSGASGSRGAPSSPGPACAGHAGPQASPKGPPELSHWPRRPGPCKGRAHGVHRSPRTSPRPHLRLSWPFADPVPRVLWFRRKSLRDVATKAKSTGTQTGRAAVTSGEGGAGPRQPLRLRASRPQQPAGQSLHWPFRSRSSARPAPAVPGGWRPPPAPWLKGKHSRGETPTGRPQRGQVLRGRVHAGVGVGWAGAASTRGLLRTSNHLFSEENPEETLLQDETTRATSLSANGPPGT